MTEWQEAPLETFLDRITYGFTNPMPTTDCGPFMITAKDINGGRILYEQARRTSFEAYRDLLTDKSRPEIGDVLVTKDGTLGRMAVVDRADVCINQSVALLKPNEKIRPRYLKYLLEEPTNFSRMLGDADGSTIKHIYVTRLGKMAVRVPDVGYQDRLVEAIGSLDDKIELNRQMNATLEEMAQAIFRDWFVDFGPTRRKMEGATDPVAILGGLIADPEKAAPLAALFPSTLGEDGLPGGWEERSVNDDFDVVMGQSPPGSTYNEDGDGLAFFQGRRDFKFRFPEKRVYCNAPTRLAEEDWTLVSVRAPVGDINRAWERCCIGRGVGALMHKQGLSSLTYYAGLHLRDELATYDKDGTVFGSINQKQLKGLKLNATNSDAAAAFDELVVPIDDLIRGRTAENKTLAATRNLLLPKLMSGEIRLREAEVVA